MTNDSTAPFQDATLEKGPPFLCPEYRSKRRPREHQARALNEIKNRRAFALLQAMRTGKTKVAVDDWGRMVCRGLVDDLLVIGPKGALPPWVDALKADLPDDLLSRTLIHTWDSGKVNQRSSTASRQALLQAPLGTPRILIMNVEAISQVVAARNLCKTFLEQRPGRSVCVIDESVCIKGFKAKCANFCVNELAPRSAYRRILSGLVTPHSPLDLFQQFKFLDWSILGFTSYFSFRARYAIIKKVPMRGFTVPIIVGYRGTDELAKKIEPHSFRVKLEDCYDMPSSDYSFRDVELTKEQRKIYDEMKKFATAEISSGEHVTASQVIVQMLRLHQVLCGHVPGEDGKQHFIPENRTASLIELLRDYEGKAVIWCSYDLDIRKVSEAIIKEFGEGSTSRFWGGNVTSREQEEYFFRNYAPCRFMVGTPDAGGKGRDWSIANLVVYYSSRNNLDHRSQSEERVKADGKKDPIAYVDLRAPGTVDEKIIHALRRKIDISTVINNDSWKEWLI